MNTIPSFTGRKGIEDALLRIFGIRVWLVTDYQDEFIAMFPSTEQGQKDLTRFVDGHWKETGGHPTHIQDWCHVCAWNIEDAKEHYFKAFEQYQEQQ